MVKKIIKNKGGLHNRLNHRIALSPFPLGLCEKLAQSRGLVLNRKRNVFQTITGTKKAIHSIMVTTDGLTRNEYWGDIQAEIQLDDLYEL